MIRVARGTPILGYFRKGGTKKLAIVSNDVWWCWFHPKTMLCPWIWCQIMVTLPRRNLARAKSASNPLSLRSAWPEHSEWGINRVHFHANYMVHSVFRKFQNILPPFPHWSNRRADSVPRLVKYRSTVQCLTSWNHQKICAAKSFSLTPWYAFLLASSSDDATFSGSGLHLSSLNLDGPSRWQLWNPGSDTLFSPDKTYTGADL